MFRIPGVLALLFVLVWAIAEAPTWFWGRASEANATTHQADGTSAAEPDQAGNPVFIDDPNAEYPGAGTPYAPVDTAEAVTEAPDGQVARLNNWLETVLDTSGDADIVALASTGGAGAPGGASAPAVRGVRPYISTLGGFPGVAGGVGAPPPSSADEIDTLPGGQGPGDNEPTPAKPSDEPPTSGQGDLPDNTPPGDGQGPGSPGGNGPTPTKPSDEPPANDGPDNTSPGDTPPGNGQPDDPDWEHPPFPGDDPVPPVTVPEPGALGLFVLGLAGAAAMRRRRPRIQK